MERLKQWWNNPQVMLTMVVMVALMALGMSLTAVWVHKATERCCIIDLEKAVVTAIDRTAKAMIGQPANIDDLYSPGDIVYCLANAEAIDRNMGLVYRVIEAPTTAQYVVSINDTDGEIGFAFKANTLYLVKNDGDGNYWEEWTPPEGYIEKFAQH